MSRYQDKRIVITGGGSGIGLATAELLVAEGARVLITGRTESTLDAAVKRLGERAGAVRADVSRAADIDRLAGAAREAFGEVDALIVGAGINEYASLEATSEEDYDRLMDTNVRGAFFTVQRFSPLLAEGAGVVLVSSIAGVLGQPDNSVYSAGKAAVRSLARTFGREFAPRGIRVNALSPGPIDTVLFEKVFADSADQIKAQVREINPLGRLGDPGEAARAAAFLAFEATYTTGSELFVDGGMAQL
jgi:NAD(P)-dependent dehydrogenase (short-subunit alcohol dehydrogenase family)